MELIEKKSTRQRKTDMVKQKLLNAMTYIMEKYDYNTLTIRNICTASGVSYGSFYNLFESKEAFLTYYLTHDFVDYKNQYYSKHIELEQFGPFEKIIDIFKCCGKYNEDKGLEFIRGFYSPYNNSLAPSVKGEGNRFHSFTPLYDESLVYLKDAVQLGLLKPDAIIETVANHFCFLFNGVTFNWCISKAGFPIVDTLDNIFRQYLKTITSKNDV